MTHWYEDDDALLDELGRSLRTAVPEVEAAAKALFTWRTIDDDLAALAYDSALAGDAVGGGVRGETATEAAADARGEPPASAVLRTLTFTTQTMAVEIGVRHDGIIGQIVPPQPGRVEIQTEEGVTGAAEIDDLGCFTVLPAPRVRFRLHLEVATGRAVTAWVLL